MQLLTAFFVFAPFFIQTNALKCLVCDSIYQSADSACQLKNCDEYVKQWLEFEDKFLSEGKKLNCKDQDSLEAYYHNITKTFEKKNLSDNPEKWSKFFDVCISKFGVYDGKSIKMKACGREKWNSCKTDTNLQTFNSCSTCETDFCNTLQCYSCGDTVITDISQISPCKNNILQNFCYGDHTRCFSATSVKNGRNVNYKGCIYKNKTQNATKFFEKEMMTYYFCEENLCNEIEEPPNSAQRTNQKCNNSCKNTQRLRTPRALKKQHERSMSDDDDDFTCTVCENLKMENEFGCSLQTCLYDEKIPKNSTFNCVSANGTINGEKLKYKACTYEGSGICNDLSKKGYESCFTCNETNCNQLRCYECDDGETYLHWLSPCKKLKVTACNRADGGAKCFSAKGVMNGHDAYYKDCIFDFQIDKLIDYYKIYGFSAYVCEGNLCNQNDTSSQPKKDTAIHNGTKPEKETTEKTRGEPREKIKNGGQELVPHLSVEAFVIIMCLYTVLKAFFWPNLT